MRKGEGRGKSEVKEGNERKERYVALTGIVPLHIVFPLR